MSDTPKLPQGPTPAPSAPETPVAPAAPATSAPSSTPISAATSNSPAATASTSAPTSGASTTAAAAGGSGKWISVLVGVLIVGGGIYMLSSGDKSKDDKPQPNASPQVAQLKGGIPTMRLTAQQIAAMHALKHNQNQNRRLVAPGLAAAPQPDVSAQGQVENPPHAQIGAVAANPNGNTNPTDGAPALENADQHDTREVTQAVTPKLEHCFAQSGASASNNHVVLDLVVNRSPNGAQLSDGKIVEGNAAADVSQCVLEQVKTASLPAPTGSGELHVRVPYDYAGRPQAPRQVPTMRRLGPAISLTPAGSK